ncbi:MULTISPECIES: CamS family sex pheromone protein [Aerococcus]|uniref:CamS family sex pheromone protein n=1 Tax=Aerococcus sanguinicola TaxID=119206 RepID=A0A5N1GPT8_9LACT|nr:MULTISPECIES: CamS family sex pheromone protein [Aerococcus]KAA9302238.1 CamS family sex pheromone protein [Aerococcus sanguinicola]MDK6368989.1 CamS family sex pheromone protein [Aerococcus sp. UMB9870]MDK6678892.1 CamS family sex pheromone protein [Aerococcus sp. UMB8608]MDK6686790.1 CamS family sex pheromone protein [Aerococcus sp. UMB8623]MDK6939550.1 CamS family sex pheromone protein [Aerococcus sp. UMB8487]
MKRLHYKLGLLACLALALAGCQTPDQAEEGQAQDQAQSGQEAQTDDQEAPALSINHYPAAIEEGHYKMSESRGLMARPTSEANMRNFEEGLYRIAEGQFSTEEYYFQEGQLITREMANQWLGAKTEDNPEGLNPEASASDKREDYQPKYLNSILEYNFMKKDDEDNYKLEGVTIGLALNSEDTFSNGESQEKIAIDKDQALEHGKQIAEEVVARIRKDKKYAKLPIQVALFYNGPTDSLAGGAYAAEVVSVAGTAFSDWENYDTQNHALGVDSGAAEEDNVAFARFTSEVEDFFPRLSGISGVGTYEEGRLSQIDIEINTQFDGYSEIIALVQHTMNTANTIFRNNRGAITIRVEGPSGMRAIMERQAGENNFTYEMIS